MRLIIALLLAASAFAQSNVAGTTTVAGETATLTITLTRVPKLAVTAACPATQVLAGASVTCALTLSKPAPTGGVSITWTSADLTQFLTPVPTVFAVGATAASVTIFAAP